MKTLLSMVLAGCGLACDAAPPGETTPRLTVPGQEALKDDFEKDQPKWKFTEGRWERRAGALVQSGTVDSWAVALLEDKKFSDVDVSVRVKPVSGREDQSGGIIFRAKDAKNYYIVRSNALEDNFRLYTMTAGSRKQIASTRVDPPKAGQWHTLRVTAKGAKIQAYLEGKLMIDLEDAAFASGFVGLWTKADSVTEFDDFQAAGSAP